MDLRSSTLLKVVFICKLLIISTILFPLMALAGPDRGPIIAQTQFNVTPQGGNVSIKNFGSAVFPKNFVKTGTAGKFTFVSKSYLLPMFDNIVPLYDAKKSPYLARIILSKTPPITKFQITLNVPKELKSSKPVGHDYVIYVAAISGGGEEVLDEFEPIPSTYNLSTNTVTADIDPSVFTALRRSDKNYEAVMLLGTMPSSSSPTSTRSGKNMTIDGKEIPGPNPSDGRLLSQGQANDIIQNLIASPSAATCKGSSLGQPIDGNLIVKDIFCLGAACPRKQDHKGVDYAAADGTQIKSVSTGKIIGQGYQLNTLANNHPVTKKKLSGWGYYIIVQHNDGGASIYGHLKKGTFKYKLGDTVSAGAVIALSDTSGAATGPHLHFEYMPELYRTKAGVNVNKSSRVDPVPCVGATITGAITIGDNGPAADDAFVVQLDGKEVCRTQIGAYNTCAIGGLAPGQRVLTVIAIIAPDDDGTYEVSLSQGLTFVAGGTSRSGDLPQGGAVSFDINVPAPGP